MKRRIAMSMFLMLAVFLFGSLGLGNKSSIQAASRNSPAPLLMDNFEDGDLRTALGTEWIAFDDNSQGGKSTITVSVVAGGAHGSKKSLRIAGKVTTDFKYGGFAGIRMVFGSNGANKDMTAYTGVQFYARGDGRQYRSEVMTSAVKDFNEYGKEFTTGKAWQLYKFPFSELAQSTHFGRKVKWTGTDVRGVVFVTSGFPLESYMLQVDDISFY